MGSNYDATSFSSRLKAIIGEDNINTAAQKCGMTAPAFSKYLKGISLPGLEFLVKIARAYDVNIEWLATGCGPMRGAHLRPMETKSLKEKKRPFESCPDGGVYCPEFGKNLKRLRQELGLTIEKLCWYLDVRSEDYEAMEDGFLPGFDFLEESLAPIFGCNPGVFFYGESFLQTKNSVRQIFLEKPKIIKHVEIEDVLNIDFNDAIPFQVLNDTMAPTLLTYDTVLCKKITSNFSSGIYVIDAGLSQEVRRLTLTHNSMVIISCDNSQVPSYTTKQNEIIKKIIGKVAVIIKSVS